MRSKPDGGATMTGLCFVDLCGSSDEEDDGEEVVILTEFPAHLSHRASRKSHTDTNAEPNSNLVVLEDVDRTKEELERETRKESRRSSQSSTVLDGASDDDDCCVLIEDPSKVEIVQKTSGNESDDLVMTGEIGQVACRDFPHARHSCAQFPFKTTAHEVFCSQCHCYVCDMLAPCSLWGDGTRGGDHCHASDKIGERWKLLRQYNKTHPTGCSDPTTLQRLLSRTGEPSVAGKLDSSAHQRCSYPAGYEHLLVQSKEFISQFMTDLFGSERESRVSKCFEALASTSSSSTRRFSRSPPVDTGNSESTSFRDLLGCHLVPGDSARSRYPLQISLNRSKRDHPSSHHTRRNYHSQGLGVRTKLHRYVPHRKSPHYSNMFVSQQSGGVGDAFHQRRASQRKSSFSVHSPHSFSNSGQTIQRSQTALSEVHIPTATTTSQQESFGGTISNRKSVLTPGFLKELSARQNFISSTNPGTTGFELQSPTAESPSVSMPLALNFESAPSLRQNEIHAHDSHFHGDAAEKFCDSLLVETQFSSPGSLSESRAEEGRNSLPTTPTLLEDYLLNGDEFWDDLQPEHLIGI